MFDSLKKKFSVAAGKLTKKVSKEAEEENNIKTNEGEIELQDKKSIEPFEDKKKDIKAQTKDIALDKQIEESKGIVEDKQIEESKAIALDKQIEESKGIVEDKQIEESKGIVEDKQIEESKGIALDKQIEESKDDSAQSNALNKDKIAKKPIIDEKNKIKNVSDEKSEKTEINNVLKTKGEKSIENKESSDEKSEKSKKGKFRDKIKLPSFKSSKEEFVEEDKTSKKDLKTGTDEELEEEETSEKKKKSGVLSFIREKTISENDVDDILWELELSLLESDVAIDVANIVVESVKEDLIGKKIKRSQDIENYTYEALQNAVSKIIDIEGESMTKMIEEKKAKGEPLVVMFVGINGTGKTTTIAKLANFYMKKGYTPVVAASDTFRAGAIEQITHHTDNLDIKIIKHQKGSDPAAVAFDAVEHAKAKNKELVLIDTAGRMQTNTNLMDEMKKIKRVAKPDLVVFVGDALTGNDAVEQATKFNDTIDIDGVILTKADADSKGGASLSIGYVIGKPIMFLGMGQGYEDIKEYDSAWMLGQIFS